MASETDERVVQVLGRTDTATIATLRGGDPVATFVWSVAVDGTGYVRSAYGPTSKWYERATSAGSLMLDLDASPEDTSGRPDGPLVNPIELRCDVVADTAELEAVDSAFQEKYGHDPENLAPLLSDESRACTLRLSVAV